LHDGRKEPDENDDDDEHDDNKPTNPPSDSTVVVDTVVPSLSELAKDGFGTDMIGFDTQNDGGGPVTFGSTTYLRDTSNQPPPPPNNNDSGRSRSRNTEIPLSSDLVTTSPWIGEPFKFRTQAVGALEKRKSGKTVGKVVLVSEMSPGTENRSN